MTKEKRPFWRRIGNAIVLLILLPFIVPLALLALVLYLPHRLALYMLVVVWLPKGKNVLLVYSESNLARIHAHSGHADRAGTRNRFELVGAEQMAMVVISRSCFPLVRG
jgi:hypothetical protein